MTSSPATGGAKSGVPITTYDVTLHEIGHAIGLNHVQVGVMAGDGSMWPKFAPEDLAECRRRGVCR